MDDNSKSKSKKWDFDDYAFTITGIIVFLLLPAPEILYARFGISIFGGSLGNEALELFEGLEDGRGINVRSIHELRSLSALLFLLTTSICLFKDAIVTRKNGGYEGSLFSHTFESDFEDAIYMTITTVMVYVSIIFGVMFASWLAGPITWILFVFIFPIVRKKSNNADEVKMPWLLLLIFVGGIIAEAITGEWIAFPLSWLIICVIKLVSVFREKIFSADTIFEILYYAFSIALLAVGMIFDFWMISWAAFPVVLLICWILSKFKRFKKVNAEADG